MKKRLLLLLLVAIAAISSQAATKYEINVGGVEVTSDNCNNVTGGDIKSGTVKYDPSSNTLTLTNVTITRTGGSNYGIHNRDCAWLTMKFVGTCNVSSNTANALHLDVGTHIEITSGSTLNASITAGENYGRGVIYSNGTFIEFRGPGTLNVSGKMKEGGSRSSCATCGFEGKGTNTLSSLRFVGGINVVMDVTHSGIYKFNSVEFYSSDVKVNYDYGFFALYDVGELTFYNNVKCVTPADATFNSSGGYFGGNDYYTHFTNNYGAIISTANFPDANFRTYMRSLCSWAPSTHTSNIIREQYLTPSEVQNLTSLSVNSKSISNLTGIGLLTYLNYLDCSSNNLTSLPSLPNTITELGCSYNQLTSLPTLPTSLQKLYCQSNQLTSLPTLPSPIQILNCQNNKFTSLSITGKTNFKTLYAQNNVNLTSLECYDNALTTLNVDGCTALNRLICYNNQFATLSITGKTNLKTLLAGDNTKLTSLDCSGNALTLLDVSGCSALNTLNCSNNKFTALEISGIISLKTLNAQNNTSLTDFNCKNNALTSLNVSGCSAMTQLNCSGNSLTALPTSLPTSLKELYCGNNKFTSLSISGKTNLKVLNAQNNTSLTAIYCYDNALTSLNVSGCSALTTLYCYNNALTSLNVSGCSAMTTLYCNDNKLASLNLTNLSKLVEVRCYRNELTSLTVQGNTALKTLNTFGNNLTSLSVQGCNSLNHLNIRANQIKESAMTSLINSMRSIPASESEGTFYVYGENYSGDKPEGNVITAAQAKTAKDKRWRPQHKVGDDWFDIPTGGLRGDLNGDGEVDVSDVNIMIDMVLGKQDKDFTIANLNGDNDVDVSDVNILIDIVLGKD